MPIRRLPPAVASRIAAGEVIERPASVVKELVENSLDAGARRVTIEVENGGVELIQVADDGGGIERAQLGIAFERHATSKLDSDDDLARIDTLGFRGEALPSIAAVADVDCVSRTAAEPHAWRLRLRGEAASPLEPAVRTVGTTMTVRQLFAELPARRKFLRGRGGESGQVAAVVSQVALGFPEVAFVLTIDGRRALETSGDGDLLAAVEAVHGRAAAANMVPIQDDPPRTGQPELSISGCLGLGEATLPTRAGITIMVNRRWVQHRSLSYALDEAYRTLIPVGRHPIVVLDLRLPPSEVDVNVHPRKTEVRLLRERAIFAALQGVVHRTLAGAGAPRGTALLASELENGHSLENGWVSDLRVLGQAGGTYIIAEGRAGLYLVDQHAAHERVVYEALSGAWRGRSESQALLEPSVIELSPREAAIIQDHLEDLRMTGYEAEPFGERALLVRAVPAPLAARDPLRALQAAVTTLAEEAPPPDWRERLAILFACHTAVRAGDRLAPDEMAALLEQLGEAELCQACSHGRPTAILLSHNQLAREFGRS